MSNLELGLLVAGMWFISLLVFTVRECILLRRELKACRRERNALDQELEVCREVNMELYGELLVATGARPFAPETTPNEPLLDGEE